MFLACQYRVIGYSRGPNELVLCVYSATFASRLSMLSMNPVTTTILAASLVGMANSLSESSDGSCGTSSSLGEVNAACMKAWHRWWPGWYFAIIAIHAAAAGMLFPAKGDSRSIEAIAMTVVIHCLWSTTDFASAD